MPMTESDVEYLTRRAEQHLQLAQQAVVPAVTAAHYRFATAYLDRIDQQASEGADHSLRLDPFNRR